MKEFLSNSWVVSIISGILVFFVTNFFVILKGKKESKKKIYNANVMVLNHLRGYVVDNGLPSQKIIEAVKNSIVREYNIKKSDLLSTKELCEELVKDIIGNTYISNDNKKFYLNMLEEYLDKNENTDNLNDKPVTKKHNDKAYEYISMVISIIAGLITTLGVSLSTIIDDVVNIKDSVNINNLIILFVSIMGFVIFIYFINKRKK